MDVSVALCTYNGEDYIGKQLRSILDQTYELQEVVISDDCSTDSTVEKLQQYKREYPDLIKIYSNEANVGIEQNFSRCIERCSGDLIAISDQDDIWHEEKIKREVKAYSQMEASLVFHNSTIVTNSLEKQGDFWSSVRYQNPNRVDQGYLLRELAKHNFVQGCTMLFDASLKDYILPIPDEWKYDYYIAVVAAMANGLYPIDDELLLYRQHNSQAIGSPEENNLTQVVQWLQSSLAMNRCAHHGEEAKKWEALMNIDSTQKCKFSIVREKYYFEKKRSEIYNPSVGRQQSIENTVENWRKGRYKMYTEEPLVHAMKDLLSTFLVSVSSRIA